MLLETWHLDARSPGCNLVPLVISIIAAKEGSAQESKGARCATDGQSTKCRQHREQRDGRTAGSWNDLGGWCCSFDKSLSCDSSACSQDKQLATKQIYAGSFRAPPMWINIPFFALISDEFSWDSTQGFAPMRCSLQLYHRNTAVSFSPFTTLSHVSGYRACEKVLSLPRDAYIIMCKYWFVSWEAGRRGLFVPI